MTGDFVVESIVGMGVMGDSVVGLGVGMGAAPVGPGVTGDGFGVPINSVGTGVSDMVMVGMMGVLLLDFDLPDLLPLPPFASAATIIDLDDSSPPNSIIDNDE